MPTFDTPEPISVTVDLSVGSVRIAASDRADTVVDVQPSSLSDESDVDAAGKVRVDYANGVLTIVGPKPRMFDFSRKTRSVEVSIELPSGSRLHGETAVGDLYATGRLGDVEFKSSAGNAQVERAGALRLTTSAGHLGAERAGGNTEISTSSGKVRIGDVDGTLTVKNSNGETEIGAVTGDVRVRSANGDISVERAGASVDAKTANGSVRVGEVARGLATLSTSMGDLKIGIAAGTAAWLEVNTGFGQVHNQLASADRPEDSDETVKVQGHTAFGSITIHRA
ncbi:DUF4097 family beta strand repeat-containing protein [Kutzneria sp. NPDC052558]|uniref:DUF4097 family beta strand repeat-containing protein n=1 Tax=Kutzneria sp. NPDC052558 TaxID=3364121 RepID=UPI0037CA2E6D